MVAAPQQTGQILNVTVKVDTFVKEQGLGLPEPEVAAPAPDNAAVPPNAAPPATAGPRATAAQGAGL
jgi:hypothetical protein